MTRTPRERIEFFWRSLHFARSAARAHTSRCRRARSGRACCVAWLSDFIFGRLLWLHSRRASRLGSARLGVGVGLGTIETLCPLALADPSAHCAVRSQGLTDGACLDCARGDLVACALRRLCAACLLVRSSVCLCQSVAPPCCVCLTSSCLSLCKCPCLSVFLSVMSVSLSLCLFVSLSLSLSVSVSVSVCLSGCCFRRLEAQQ